MMHHRPFFTFRFSLIITLAVLACVLPANAQWFPETLLSSPTLAEADSNRLSLHTDITGFFKNNEYFSPVAVGQTLPGVSSILALGYQVSGKFRVELGAYAVKYSGRDPLERLQVFARLQYAIKPDFNMVVGNIYGGVNHRLIEPLYQWERQFTDNPESGLQFVLHNERWFTDVWVDWQHFIERGDPVPESLTFGTSVSYLVTQPSSKLSVTIPFQLLIAHQGGQIDTSDDLMIVLGNAASGVSTRWNANTEWLKYVGFDVYVAGYYDRYPDPQRRPYKNSVGVYPVLLVNAKSLEVMAGYWQTEKFYAPKGEPLFGSFNPYAPSQRLPQRKLLTFKLAYSREIAKGVFVGAQLEMYKDLILNATDYSFGVNLRLDKRFLLTKAH